MMEKTFWGLFCLTGSLFMFYQAYEAFSGRKKCWRFGLPHYRARGITSIGVGSAIFLLMTSLILLPRHGLDNTSDFFQNSFIYIYIALPIGSVVLLWFEPSCTKPAWVKWFEQERKYLYPIIKKEIEKVGCKKWEEMVKTDEEFKDWVNALDKRHRSPTGIMYHW